MSKQDTTKKPTRRSIVRPDLNLKNLSRQLGISHTHCTAIFRGDKNPSLRLALRMAHLMGMTVEELVGWLDIYKTNFRMWARYQISAPEVWQITVGEGAPRPRAMEVAEEMAAGEDNSPVIPEDANKEWK